MFSTDLKTGPLIYTGILVLCGIYGWSQRRARHSRLPLPPGPKGLPLIGNLLDIPSTFQWKQYAKWSEEYNSDIIFLNIAGTSIVVVNSHKVATDLFDKRSSIYSSRPDFPMVKDLVKLDWAFSFMKYGESWRERRKLFQKHFHPLNTEIHQPREEEHIHKLLKNCHQSPAAYADHIRKCPFDEPLAITITTAYGLEVMPSNDPYVELGKKAMVAFAAMAAPGAFLVDSIPALKYVPSWFPGAGFKRKAYEWEWTQWRRLTKAMLQVTYFDSEKAVAAGIANQNSFVATCLGDLDEAQDLNAQRGVIKDTAGIFTGGVDSSFIAIIVFILQMTLNPEIQAKGQAELDRVVGKYNLPTVADEQSLPYIGAIVKEVLSAIPSTTRRQT